MRFILAFLFSLSPAIAQQGGGVVQIGADTANNCVKWVSSTKITDAGATCGGGGGGSGTVTSVGQTFTGGLISVGGSPVTTSGTLALTVAGTSGGVPYFSGAATWASSATLTANALMIGGGAGAAPSTTTTGTGVLTALGSAVNGSGAISLTTNPVFNNPTLRDSNSLNVLTVNAVASAVNYFQMENAATGGSVHLYAIGTDANIGIHLAPKGTGQVNIQDGTDTTKRIRFDPSGNGTGVITTLASGSTANRTLTLPDLTTTLAGLGLAQTFSAAQTFTSGIISNTLALGGATIGSNALAVTGNITQTAASSATFVGDGAATPTTGTPGIAFAGATGVGFRRNSTSGMIFTASGADIWFTGASNISMRSNGTYSWSATTDPIAGAELTLVRDSANVLGIRNSTTAMGLLVYRTYTDASNYQRLNHKWNTSTSVIQNEGAGTGANGSIAFGSAALATNATKGFIMIPTTAGTPTGVPADVPTGQVAMVYDTSAHQFWIYDGSWLQPKTPAAAAIVSWQ